MSIYAGVNGHLDTIPVRDIVRFEEAMLSAARDRVGDAMADINKTGNLSESSEEAIKSFLVDFAKNFA